MEQHEVDALNDTARYHSVLETGLESVWHIYTVQTILEN